MNIVLIGIQGSGKGTLVSGLEKRIDMSLISMGQLLRDEAATGSVLGEKIKSAQSKGVLVANDIVIDTLKKKLSTIDNQVVVFDGFPRNSEQADMLDSITSVDLVIHLNLSKEVALNRLVNRLTCADCGYITAKNTTGDNICPVCGGKLVQRNDDNEASINKRFEVYDLETKPLLDRYRARGVLVDIDANRTPDEILVSVMKVIYEYIN